MLKIDRMIAAAMLVGLASMVSAPSTAVAGDYYGSAGHSYFHDAPVRHQHFPNVGPHRHLPFTRAHSHNPAYQVLRIHVRPSPALHTHRRVEHWISEFSHRHM